MNKNIGIRKHAQTSNHRHSMARDPSPPATPLAPHEFYRSLLRRPVVGSNGGASNTRNWGAAFAGQSWGTATVNRGRHGGEPSRDPREVGNSFSDVEIEVTVMPTRQQAAEELAAAEERKRRKERLNDLRRRRPLTDAQIIELLNQDDDEEEEDNMGCVPHRSSFTGNDNTSGKSTRRTRSSSRGWRKF